MGALRQGNPAMCRHPTVARFVGDDLAQPRLERRARAKPAERVVGVHKSLLRGILRVGGVPGDLVGDPVRQLLVLLDKCFIGVDIAGSRAFDERYIVQWSALHGSFAIPSYQPTRPMVPLKACLSRRPGSLVEWQSPRAASSS